MTGRLADGTLNVVSSVVTMTSANPGVVTWTGHTLQNGDIVEFSTTGALPTAIAAGTEYYVVNVDTNTFQISATSGGTAINTTAGAQSGTHTARFGRGAMQNGFVTTNKIADGSITTSKLAGNVDQLATAWVLFRGDIAESAVAGAVFTRLTDTKIQVTRSTGHGLANGNWITFHALTGFYAFLNGTWEVQNATATTFEFNLAGATTPSAAVTITTANPAVITWTGHALAVGQTVTFSTTGTLPTGITAGTTYFVKTATAGTTFTISLTSGGTAIATTAAGTGTHTATLTGVMTSQIFRPVAINRKYNISKVGRLDLGKYRVFFDTKPLTVDYISLGSAADASGDAVGLVGATAQTIDYADIVTTNSAGTNANYNAVRLVVFGG